MPNIVEPIYLIKDKLLLCEFILFKNHSGKIVKTNPNINENRQIINRILLIILLLQTKYIKIQYNYAFKYHFIFTK